MNEKFQPLTVEEVKSVVEEKATDNQVAEITESVNRQAEEESRNPADILWEVIEETLSGEAE